MRGPDTPLDPLLPLGHGREGAVLWWAARNVQDRYYVAVVDADLHKAILKLYADDPFGI